MLRFSPLCVGVFLYLATLGGHAIAQTDPALVSASSLSNRSVGAVDYSGRVRLALLQMAQQHPEVLTAKSEETISGFEAEAAKTARYPRFALGAATGRSANTTSSDAQAEPFTALTASVRMSLIDGGLISSRVRAADARVGASSEAVRSASQKVILDGITAYFQVQRFDLKKRIAEKATKILDELTRAEQRRVDLGAAGQGDARQAASRRATFAAKEQEFNSLLADALAKFETYFKFPANAALLPTLTAPKRWAVRNFQQAMDNAEATSSELGEARKRIEQGVALVDREKASRFPTLEAVLSKTKDDRALATDPTRAALELNVNLGNGFDAQARINSAIAELSAREARLDAARANLFEVTSSAYGRTVAGAEREKQLMEAVKESDVAFQSKRRLLGFGRETLQNVLDAQLEHYTLLLDLADAVFDLRVSEFRLARTAGKLYLVDGQDTSWLNTAVFPVDSNDFFARSLRDAPCKVQDPACSLNLVDPNPGKEPVPNLKKEMFLNRVSAGFKGEPAFSRN